MPISASSFAARSSRPPLRNASTDSRRVLTSRVSTASVASSESWARSRFSRARTLLQAIRRVSRRNASPDRMAAVMSSWRRSRRDTGGGSSRVGRLPAVPPDGVMARRLLALGASGARDAGRGSGWNRRLGAGRVVRPGWADAFPRRRSRRLALLARGLLALCFLPLPLHAGLLVVLATAGLSENAGLLDLLVEATKRALEGLVLTNSDLCQCRDHLLRPGIVWPAAPPGECRRTRVRRRARTRPPDPAECSPGEAALANGAASVEGVPRRRAGPRPPPGAAFDAVTRPTVDRRARPKSADPATPTVHDGRGSAADPRHRATGRAPSGAGSGRGSSAPSRPASGTRSPA